jgi:hypothetical protein
VLPVVHQLRDGTWIASIELWGDSVAVRWGQRATPRAERYIEHSDDYASWHPTAFDGSWTLADDVGTQYAKTGAGASGHDEEHFRGEVEFAPSPPSAATELRLALDDQAITIHL